jgi:DNA-binding PadR family transcriptional regulator
LTNRSPAISFDDISISDIVLEGSMPSAKVEKWLPLSTSDFHILLSLVSAEAHGYAIMREVSERTGGRMRIGPGTLYGAIKRMVAEGLIAEVGDRTDQKVDPERRRYYRLTPLGRRVAAAEAGRLAELVCVATTKKLISAEGLKLRGAHS